MSKIKVGDEVTYGAYKGVAEDINTYDDLACVYFPNGGPDGKHTMMISVANLTKASKWERVGGKLRIMNDRDDGRRAFPVLASELDSGRIYVERLVEE